MCQSIIRKALALLLTILVLATCLTACTVTVEKNGEDKDEKPTASQSDKEDDTAKDEGKDEDEGKNNDKDEEKDEEDNKDPETENPHTEDGFFFYQEDHVDLGTPDKTLDPQEVYDNLTYIPEMFYGRYTLLGGNDAQEEFGEETNYVEYTLGSETAMLSELPFGFDAGKHTPAHTITFVDGYHWMRVYFMRQYEHGNYLDTQLCAYTVEDNLLKMHLIDTFHVDQETNKITYSFADVVLEYEFSFCGRQLTLFKDDSSVTMWTGLDAYAEEDYIYVSHYLAEGTPALGNLDYLNLRYSADDNDSYFSVDGVDGDRSYQCIAYLEENGLFTVTIPWEEGETATYQMVYFYCDDDGILLTDGTNHYFYTHQYSDRCKSDLRDYISEDQTGKMDELTDSQIEQVVQTKEQLLGELEQAFEDEGISISINADTGEMAMDASILFGGDSAELTEKGKDFIARFVKVYTTVTANQKYADFISHTMVEGHTAPVGNSSYEDGLPLSEERANVVKNHCLSLDDGAMEEDDLEAVGYSNSKPIKDKDGNVDMAASRRVSFRFIIDLENFFN